MIAAYMKVYGDFGCFHLVPLKPTGKYRIQSGPNYKDRMFIQHKGTLFKKWVPEESIVFEEEFSQTEYNCSQGGSDNV